MRIACSLVVIAFAHASAGTYSSYRAQVQATQVEVESRLTAPVTRVLVRDGQFVAQGDVLVELDDKEPRANIAAAHVELTKNQQELVATESALKMAPADLREPARTKVELARLKVKLAQSRIDLAELQLGYTTIKAEISGMVTLRALAPGQTVERFQAIATIVDVDHVWVDGVFTDPQVRAIKVGQDADVAIAKLAFHGKVDDVRTDDAALVHTILDTGALGSGRVGVGVKIALDRHDRSLRPGMMATVTIHTR